MEGGRLKHLDLFGKANKAKKENHSLFTENALKTLYNTNDLGAIYHLNGLPFNRPKNNLDKKFKPFFKGFTTFNKLNTKISFYDR